jgi:hypothetical protein
MTIATSPRYRPTPSLHWLLALDHWLVRLRPVHGRSSVLTSSPQTVQLAQMAASRFQRCRALRLLYGRPAHPTGQQHPTWQAKASHVAHPAVRAFFSATRLARLGVQLSCRLSVVCLGLFQLLPDLVYGAELASHSSSRIGR